jgi:hypothetical protein
MKRVLCTMFAVVALGISGCGESGDVTTGVPKDQGYVPPGGPNGQPMIPTDMSKTGGIRPPKTPPKDAAKPPADSGAPAK